MVIAIVASVWLTGTFRQSFNIVFPIILPYLGFMAAGIADVYNEIGGDEGAGRRARAMVLVVLKEALGLGVFFVCFFVGAEATVFKTSAEPPEDVDAYVAQVRAERDASGGGR